MSGRSAPRVQIADSKAVFAGNREEAKSLTTKEVAYLYMVISQLSKAITGRYSFTPACAIYLELEGIAPLCQISFS